jgi:class 3 adenylate cyclase
MEPSEEIRELMLEVARAVAEADDATWRRLWSSRSGVISLGSDPREWSEGFEAIVSLAEIQKNERGRAIFRGGDIAAFQEGSVGWGVQSSKFEYEGGLYTFRLSAVFHLERGKWKLVHSHRSFGVKNEDIPGVHMTTTLDTVAEAVERERPNLSRAAAPNGTVTILFTDIEGSTRMTERLGDRAWMAVLHEHNTIVREQAAFHSGFEVKSQGDGFMLAFASARNAVQCSIGIQQALAHQEITGDPLRVRIGVHTGEAIREADDFYGKAVILAARIAAEARGSEILVSSLVRELIESSGEFGIEGPSRVELRGLRGVHDLYVVRWRDE